ncbi:MAG: hypothetical protein ACEQSK_00005 [Sphingomonadaceae bacterium]
MGSKKDTDWTLVAATSADIAAVRERCRGLVRRRALWSAGASAVPIPGLDLVTDVRLFALLIDDINQEFGLSPAQIERLSPKFKLIAYEAAVGAGGMLVGKVVTREVLAQLFKRTGMKALARQSGKLVPIAGQLAAAAIGYAVFRQIGYQHVDACAAVASELLSQRE